MLLRLTHSQHFKSADMVIEAVFEDLSLKHRVIKEMEESNIGGETKQSASRGKQPSFIEQRKDLRLKLSK